MFQSDLDTNLDDASEDLENLENSTALKTSNYYK